MTPPTVVYVADNGLVKIQDGINYRQERVALASDPAVAKYPDAFRLLGTVGADGLARIATLGDAATLLRVVDFITPIGVEPTTAPPRPARGRRPLTDDQVRADLDRALQVLARERGITRPSWEQLAGAHDGLGWEGMTVDGLRKRHKQHPIPFRETVPHLTE